jgi:hypothetical protein
MDEKIQEEYHAQMNVIANALDQVFNGELKEGDERRVAFVLLITEFGNMSGRVNYISNGERKDIVVMLKEILARFEGQPEMRGNA